MALSPGTLAPDFSLPTQTSEGFRHIRLSDYRGKQPVLLLFVPMAFTGVCTAELCLVSQSLNRYAAMDAAVLGISGDNPFAQEVWAQKEKITFPLLSDYEHHVAAAYGVAYDSFLPQIGLGMGGVPKRSAFLIDKEGVIQYAECNDDARIMPDFEAILAKLGTL
jgi:peroxiredoxin